MTITIDLSSLEDAMNELWFHHNIIFPNLPHTNLSSHPTPTSLPSASQTDTKTTCIIKKPKRLSIPINQPLYQLNLPPRIKTRRPAEMKKQRWSLSELENLEIEGFKDMGFVFSKEKLSQEMVKMIPGLRRLGGEEENREDGERRPYLSEVWLVDRIASVWKLPRFHDSEDMKRHLRFWAHTVASSIQMEL